MESINSSIDWTSFENKSATYIKLVAGRRKSLRITSVVQVDRQFEKRDKMTGALQGTEQRIGLEFTVAKEDGQDVGKIFTVYSKVLARQLRPIIEAGLPADVAITKIGEGFDTEYVVEKLPTSSIGQV